MGSINITDIIKLIDNEGHEALIDGATGCLYTLPLEHAFIHEEKAYVVSYDAVVPKNSNYDLLLVTPATGEIHLMMHRVTTTTSPGEFCVFEDATINTPGDPITSYNAKRSSSNTATSLVYSEPDVSADGTEIDCDIITGTKLEGGVTKGAGFEWILKPSTNYLLRYSNASGIASDANFGMFFLEVI